MSRLLFATVPVFLAVSGWAGPIVPPFTQCPPVGSNTACQFLILIGASGAPTVLADPNSPNNGPYDGSEDTLVAVQNNSSSSISSLPLSSGTAIFGFDGDGLCTVSPKPPSCPASGNFAGDPTGYGGPGVSFSSINAAQTSGIVNFNPPIPPGGSAYFGLEGTLNASQIIPGTPGGAPPQQPSGVPEPGSIALFAGGLALLGCRKFSR